MYRTIDAAFWTDPKLAKLTLQAKHLAIYLVTNPHTHMGGIYYLPWAFISVETTLSHNPLRRGFEVLSGVEFAKYDAETQVVWVKNMLRYQCHGTNAIKGVATHLNSLHNSFLIKGFLKQYPEVKKYLTKPYRTPSEPPPEGVPSRARDSDLDSDLDSGSEKSKNPPIPPIQNQSKPKETFQKKVAKRVDLWNETMGQRLKPGTYLDAFKARAAKDPELFDKMDRAIPIVREIDDSDWSNSVNLAWLLRPGRNGEIPVLDRVLDGTYTKRRRPGRAVELLEDFNKRRAHEQGGKHGSNIMEPGGQSAGGDCRAGADVFRYPDQSP